MQPFREYRKLWDENRCAWKRVAYAKWRGRIVRNGRREKVVLFTDLRASKRELAKLQAEADEETQDGAGVRRRKYALRPISDHVADYLASLRTKSDEHRRISKWMLEKLVAGCGWRRLAEISEGSVE